MKGNQQIALPMSLKPMPNSTFAPPPEQPRIPPPELSPALAAPTSCRCSFFRCGIEKLTSGSVKSAPDELFAHAPGVPAAAFCGSGPSSFRFFAAGSSAAVPFVSGGLWRS